MGHVWQDEVEIKAATIFYRLYCVNMCFVFGFVIFYT